jgi:AraC-like DNA-binding protein
MGETLKDSFADLSALDSDVLSPETEGFTWAKTCIANGGSWAVPMRHEYYECDIASLREDKKLELIVRGGMPSPFQVTSLASRYRYAFWRSWNHISRNKEQIVILRYVKSGAFSLTQCGVTLTIKPGEFTFSKSNVPFRWESLTGDLALSEYCSILLPPDLVHRFFPDGVPLKDCLSVGEHQHLAMPTLLELLTDEGQYLDQNVARMLVETVLKEAREVAAQDCAHGEARKNICDKRTEDIIAYIGLHLSNPDLSASTVARACGISPRYLCYLLKVKNTSFSVLLWEERLKKAREWLLALDTRHYTIGEIAYMNGFKTAAHFSRLFRNYFGCSPREFRQSANQQVVGAPIRTGDGNGAADDFAPDGRGLPVADNYVTTMDKIAV